MNFIFLGQVTGILSPFAWILGKILNLIYHLVEWMAAENPPYGKIASFDGSVLFNGFHCIFGTSGRVDAARHLLQPRQMLSVKPD